MKKDNQKLIFVTDFDKDIYFIKKFFPRVREVFGEKMFNDFFLRRYYPEAMGKSDKQLIKYFKQNKRKILQKTKKDGKILERKWNKIGAKFFNQVKDITGFDFKYRAYKCHLSSTFICGGCYDAKVGNLVSVFPSITHADALEVVIHELVHLHFWESLDRMKIKYNKNEKEKSKGTVWDLSEIAVNYPMLKLKLPGFRYKFKIYPQHKTMWNKIKKFSKSNFEDFVRSSIKIIG